MIHWPSQWSSKIGAPRRAPPGRGAGGGPRARPGPGAGPEPVLEPVLERLTRAIGGYTAAIRGYSAAIRGYSGACRSSLRAYGRRPRIRSRATEHCRLFRAPLSVALCVRRPTISSSGELAPLALE